MPEQLGRVIYSDDCLNVLRDTLAIPHDSVDLIYLDPPFNSKNHYNLPFTGQYAKDVRPVEAFTDLWTWGGRRWNAGGLGRRPNDANACQHRAAGA